MALQELLDRMVLQDQAVVQVRQVLPVHQELVEVLVQQVLPVHQD
jgi:hypothetical protein